MKNVFKTVLFLTLISTTAAAIEGNGDIGSGSLLKVEGIKAHALYNALGGDMGESVDETLGFDNLECTSYSPLNEGITNVLDMELSFATCGFENDDTGIVGGRASAITDALVDVGVKPSKTTIEEGTVATENKAKVEVFNLKKVSCSSNMETQQGDTNLAPEILGGKASCEIQL